ncbi:hypothetical protein AB0K52_04890 [Glycomyces sp. NPDC049804]
MERAEFTDLRDRMEGLQRRLEEIRAIPLERPGGPAAPVPESRAAPGARR